MKNTDLHQKFMKVVDLLIKKKIKTEPIQAIVLGGSVARGDENIHSDIDINFYVKRLNIPVDYWRFYKFKGKYIEEHYFPIEDLKNENFLPEEKILYDKTDKLKQNFFNEDRAKEKFFLELKEAEKYQKLAEKSFNKNNYDKTFNYLYGVGAPAFIIMHSLPPRFNLPFPSFRLLKSIKIIDKKKKTDIYKKIEEIYRFDNKNEKEILNEFEKAYNLMNKIKKEENPKSKNLGFLDKIKIKYNIKGLKETFKKYSFVYAYRFIVGCLAMWAFDNKIKAENKIRLKKYLLNVLGIKIIDKDLVKKKLELSKELIKECEKIK